LLHADEQFYKIDWRHVVAITQLIRSFRDKLKIESQYRVGHSCERYHKCKV
jgi:hypothetical protein